MEIREKLAKLLYEEKYPESKEYWSWVSIKQDTPTAEQFYSLTDKILALFSQWLEEQGAVKPLPVKGDYLFPEIHTEYEPLRIK